MKAKEWAKLMEEEEEISKKSLEMVDKSAKNIEDSKPICSRCNRILEKAHEDNWYCPGCEEHIVFVKEPKPKKHINKMAKRKLIT